MTRHRESITGEITTGTQVWEGRDKYGVLRYTAGSVLNGHTLKYIDDVVTPDYYSRLKSGEFLPINDYVVNTESTSSFVVHSGSMTYKKPDELPSTAVAVYTGSIAAVAAAVTYPSATIDSDMVENVVIKAMASAKSADFDVLTFIGEFKDTVHLFESAVHGVSGAGRRIARIARVRADRAAYRRYIKDLYKRGIKPSPSLLKKLKRTKRAANKDRLEEFSRLWLTIRYGIRPLVYDLQGALSLLNAKANNPLARKTASQTVDISGISSEVVTTYSAVSYKSTKERVGTATYYATVYYSDRMSHIGANPVITAYELTRMSFVFDWFINIGAWLQAMSPREGYNELGVSTSVTFDYNDIFVQKASEGSDHAWSISLSDLSYVEHVKRHERHPYSGIPLPHINVNLNPAKVLDLLTLVYSNRRAILGILFK